MTGRKCSEDFADCDAAALRNKRLSLEDLFDRQSQHHSAAQ
jgi:hypothetical protein